MKKVAIQGIRGAFHEEAAKAYFYPEKIEILTCLKFEQVVNSVVSKEANYGIMAIENSLIGGIDHTKELIEKHPVEICGEQRLKISLCLGGLPGVKKEELSGAYSQGEALGQCAGFFRKNRNIQALEREDTALSAFLVAEQKRRELGAIASKMALEKYGLSLIAESIQDRQENYTRFIIIQKISNE